MSAQDVITISAAVGASVQMSPDAPVNDLVNKRPTDIKRTGQLLPCDDERTVLRPNRTHLIVGELRHPVSFASQGAFWFRVVPASYPSRAASLTCAIFSVVTLRSHKQMFRSNALRCIAAMKNTLVRRDWSVLQFVREAMRAHASILAWVVPSVSAISPDVTEPQPAVAARVDEFPEGLYGFSHLLLRNCTP